MPGLPELTSSDANGKRAGAATYVLRIVIIIAAVGAVVLIGRSIRGRFLSTEQLFDLAEQTLNEEPPDFEAAESYLQRILAREPDSNLANLMMATVLVRTNRIDEALEYTHRIQDDESDEAVRARCLAGQLLLLDRKQPSAAYAEFQRAFDQDPDDDTANGYLAHLGRLGLRTWDMLPCSVHLARNGRLTPQQLYELSLGHELYAASSFIEEYSQTAPDDPIVLLGQADAAFEDGEFDRAEELYRRVIDEQPDILAAHVRLGKVFLESHNADGFYDWHNGVPEAAERHPLTWSIRGQWAEELGDTAVATRCYWESARIDPNHLPAFYRLGQLLTAEGRADEALPFLGRAELLELYSLQAQSVILLTDREEPDLEGFLSAAYLAFQLGLLAEANAWNTLILQVDSNQKDAQQLGQSLRELLPQTTGERAGSNHNPAAGIDLSMYPLPDWPSSAPTLSRPPSAAAPTKVAFDNQAEDAGVVFYYFTAGDPEIQGLTRPYSGNGGGVAVLDLDCDGWPDIHLTQGADPNEEIDSTSHLDQLFRNTGRGLFRDVTAPARLLEGRYSQGATVGDFNGDGFPDLRIANIGGNRLFQNNGDGTFEDVSEPAGISSPAWTTSCLLADLNGDGLPDLYDVNYLSGLEVLTTVCRDAEGRHHACQPPQFAPSQDELFLNRGDGTFANVTEECGILAHNGRGLGIVAGDFDGSGLLNLFIANTDAANFYFVNETEGRGGPPRFADKARLWGAAYNRNGHAESSHGVAAGDVDQDGQLELFVASSWNQTNTLYDPQPGHLFLDQASRSGLADQALRSVGFGAQLIDAALRGSLDLIIANGNVDDYDSPDIPYEMPPRYFSNNGSGHFAPLDAASLGPYFEGEYLGRSLARIDWNRDGREDIVVSHLDAPAALLTNTTEAAGRYVAVRLIGARTARDAVGTTLTLITDDGRTLVRQLTAGDGYQASNQRIIVFGLGQAGVDGLRVRWPSGIEQQFADVEPDREYLCVEGTDRLYGSAR